MNLLHNITLLITCYNKLPYLKNFVAILDQIYQVGPEIIIVDDFSTDGSREVIMKLASSLPNIQVVLNSRNFGSAASRNLALKGASREFVFFWDIDDEINVSTLEFVAKISVKESADLCQGDFIDLGSSQKVLNCEEPFLVRSDISQSSHVITNEMGYWRYLYRRQFLEKNEILFMPTFDQLQKSNFILDDVFFFDSRFYLSRENCFSEKLTSSLQILSNKSRQIILEKISKSSAMVSPCITDLHRIH